MTGKMAKTIIILAVIISLLAVSGCLSSRGSPDVTPTPVVPTPTAIPSPSITIPVPSPGTTIIWTPGGGDTLVDNNTQLIPSPEPGTNETNGTVSPTPTPQPVVSGQAKDWGTSKSTYARGETAAGWVYVTNTGNVPIDTVDFTIVIKKTIFFIPIEKSYDYSKTGLNIAPGETQKVEFSQDIPAEYSGVSTAGDYQLTVKAKLAGQEIGSYSKGIKIV